MSRLKPWHPTAFPGLHAPMEQGGISSTGASRLRFSQNHLRNLTAGTSPWSSAAEERVAEDGAFGPEKEGAAWRRDVNGRSIQSRRFSESSPFIGTTKAKKLSC